VAKIARLSVESSVEAEEPKRSAVRHLLEAANIAEGLGPARPRGIGDSRNVVKARGNRLTSAAA
jgi:hypothetical protein